MAGLQRLDAALVSADDALMTKEHLEVLLAGLGAEVDAEGWQVMGEGRLLTLYASHSGTGLTVSRIEAIKVSGDLLQARTQRGELFMLAREDVFAGSGDGHAASKRKAGFV